MERIRKSELIDEAMKRAREALRMKSSAMQELNIARSTESDDFGPIVAYARQRLAKANARVETVNAELARICQELGVRLS